MSLRTIQRDIDTLSMSGVPVYASVGCKGGYEILDSYKVDKQFLNNNEALTLVSFLESLSKTTPSTEIKSLYNKVKVLYPNSKSNRLVVKLNPHVNEKKFNIIIGNINNAIDNLRKLRISYIDSSFNESTRTVAPISIVLMGSTWYLYGYCSLRNDYRVFKINRILSCELLDDRFSKDNLPQVLEENLPWNNNMDSRRANTNIKLELNKCLLGRVPDYFSLEDCFVNEDKILVNTSYPVDEWLYGLLLSMVPNIKVVEPIWLRKEFIKRLKQGLTNANN